MEEKNPDSSRQRVTLKQTKTLAKASTGEWRMSGVIDMDFDGIQNMELPIMQEIFGELSGEDKEIIKDISYIFFYDRNDQLMDVKVNISDKDRDKFFRVEKEVYEFIKRHTNLEIFKPYLTFEGELKGVALRIPLSWLDKKSK